MCISRKLLRKKTLLFTLLVQAAYSDGTISGQEQKVLQAVAAKIDMGKEDAQHIIEANVPPAPLPSSIDNAEEEEPKKNRTKKRFHLPSAKIPRIALKEKIVLGVLLVIVFSVAGGFYVYRSKYFLTILDNLIPGGDTIIITTPPVPNPKPIDKLFTTFIYMPILDRLYNDDQTKLLGYCYRQYEVGIGYDSLNNLFTQYQEAACQGKDSALPSPAILSTNTVDSNARGDYTMIDCDSLDAGNRESHRKIKAELLRTKHWKMITKNSQNMLMGYMKVYCSEEE